MNAVHSSACEDQELLRQLVIQELKDRGITANIDHVKPKRSKTPFSTPGGSAPPSGRVFGRKITELSKVYETLDDLHDASVLVPTFVVHACNFIQEHVKVEGLFRMAGSSARQKLLRKEIEAQEIVDFRTIDPPPYVLDVASLLKQFLRELPQPLLPTNFHELLAKCISGEQSVDSLLLGILLLPRDELNCLTYLARNMYKVADNREYNKMDPRNLAIVLTPSIFSITDLCTPSVSSKEKKKLDKGTQNKLGNNMTIIEILINQASRVGILPPYLKEKYDVASLLPQYGATSHSEDNMDDNGLGPSQRKKNKHKRNRSGSLSRVLGAVGKGIQKAISRNATPAPRKLAPESIHSTPLPNFGNTPDFPSPRIRPKRKAEEHELSPSNKLSKRTFESTFTPKMRTRSFSVKRFKRKKSEGKLTKDKPSFVIHAHLPSPGTASLATSIASSCVGQSVESSLAGSMNSLAMTPKENSRMDWDAVDGNKTVEEEGDYAEVKAQYLELKDEVNKLESEMKASSRSEVDVALEGAAQRYRSSMAAGEEVAEKVLERYEAAKEAGGRLDDVPQDTASKMAKVRRRSSENKRMRSPSERKIGVIRKRSLERERKSPGRERGRSPVRKSPIAKEAITPMNLDKSYMKAKLQRGQPNTFVERPSPVIVEAPGSRPRVKMSFKEKIQPERFKLNLHVSGEEMRRLEASPKRTSRKESSNSGDGRSRSLKTSDSISSLKTDISNLIENSFGSKQDSLSDGDDDDCAFESEDNDKTVLNEDECDPFDQATPLVNPIYENAATIMEIASNAQIESTERVGDLTSKLAEVTFETPVAAMSTSTLFTDSPITRSQLRRQSSAFEFARPLDTKLPVPEDRVSLRRQSSAFEFVSDIQQMNEPIYENFMRTNSTRASLRRRNSSVKNLIQKMESEANKRMGYDVFRAKPAIVAPPTTKVDTRKRFVSEDPTMDEIGEEQWTNASDFFNDVEALQKEAPQCGRSSIAKIQAQNRGKVSEAVNKFSKPVGPKTPGRRVGATPNRKPTPGNRRQSARMGIATTASPSLIHPSGARRLTLTGIKTTTAARRTSHYTKETVSSANKQREKSPLFTASAARRLGTQKSPLENVRRQKSPMETTRRQKSPLELSKRRGTPMRVAEAIYANVPQPQTASLVDKKSSHREGQKVERRPSNNKPRVERKSSNSRDLGRKNNDMSEPNVRRSVSNGKDKDRKIKRNGSNPGKKEKKKEVRRHLTIAYPGEVRSPLKERQNLDANVKRSNSDQTPSKKHNNPPKPKQAPSTENDDYVNVVVVRKHSLRSDLLMSPRPDIPSALQDTIQDITTPRSDKVRRAMSDRCHTPRTNAPYMKGAMRTPHKGPSIYGNLDSMMAFKSLKNEMSPRRSPRLVKD